MLGSSSGGIVLKPGACFGESAILGGKARGKESKDTDTDGNDRGKDDPPLLRQATVTAVGAVKTLRLTAEKVTPH